MKRSIIFPFIRNIVVLVMVTIVLFCQGCDQSQSTLFVKFSTETDCTSRMLSAIRFDKYYNLYVVDQGKDQIIKLNADGKELAVFGNGEQGNASLEEIIDIAVDESGYMYVAENAGRIVILNLSGDVVKEWVIGPEKVTLTAISIDNEKNIYVVDNTNKRILKYDFQGNQLSQIQNYDPTNIVKTTMISPRGLTINRENLLFVGQWETGCGILVFDKSGNCINTYGYICPIYLSSDAKDYIYASNLSTVTILDKNFNRIESWKANDNTVFPKTDYDDIYSVSANSEGRIFAVRENNEILVCDKYCKSITKVWLILVPIGIALFAGEAAMVLVYRNKKKRQALQDR